MADTRLRQRFVEELRSIRDLAPDDRSRLVEGRSSDSTQIRGLIVSTFVVGEGLIRGTFSHANSRLSSRRWKGDSLPAFLIQAVETGGVKGLNEQFRYRPYPEIAVEARRLSTVGARDLVLEMPRMYVAHSSPNVDSAQVGAALSALGVSKPWACLEDTAAFLGIRSSGLQDDFEQARRLRNLAAHDLYWRGYVSDLRQVTRAVSSVAASFALVADDAVGRLLGIGRKARRELSPDRIVPQTTRGIVKIRGAWRSLDSGGALGATLGPRKRDAVRDLKRQPLVVHVAHLDLEWGIVDWRI